MERFVTDSGPFFSPGAVAGALGPHVGGHGPRHTARGGLAHAQLFALEGALHHVLRAAMAAVDGGPTGGATRWGTRARPAGTASPQAREGTLALGKDDTEPAGSHRCLLDATD